MAYLAMHGLGLTQRNIQAFAAGYRQRLTPMPKPRETLHRHTWQRMLGHADAYPELVQFFATEVRDSGWQGTLERYLPGLASGWVKDLFHPLIRLAYAIQFEAPAEVATGLAYLASLGDDPRLARAAKLGPLAVSASGYLRCLPAQVGTEPPPGLGPFNLRYRHAVDNSSLRPLAASQGGLFSDLSRACLELFDATHDFFALHLLTASHAFRVCVPWIGAEAQGMFSVGIGAAYLALGALPFAPLERADSASLDKNALAQATDEHDLKLAYSCRTLGEWDADPTYEWVAQRYLTPRLNRSVERVE